MDLEGFAEDEQLLSFLGVRLVQQHRDLLFQPCSEAAGLSLSILFFPSFVFSAATTISFIPLAMSQRLTCCLTAGMLAALSLYHSFSLLPLSLKTGKKSLHFSFCSVQFIFFCFCFFSLSISECALLMWTCSDRSFINEYSFVLGFHLCSLVFDD